MEDDIPFDAPKPRLCHLRKWSDFNGYGFNLHAERGKAGQFVGTIDDGSPAQAADLRAGDRIVEVNGTNIGSENHQQVVQRIKAVPNETKLLVVDQEADSYYRDRKIVVRGDMSNVQFNRTPEINPYTHGTTEIEESVNNVHLTTPDYDTYKARLCQLKTWQNFSGFGFNLHADQQQAGQFIGKVDDGSPAEAAGLKYGDRIVEVNGQPVTGLIHSEVIALIKATPGRVSLLVVDQDTENHFRSAGVEVHGHMIGVQTITCPDRNPYTSGSDAEAETSSHHSASLMVKAEDHVETKTSDDDRSEHSYSGSDKFRSPSPQIEHVHTTSYEEVDAPFQPETRSHEAKSYHEEVKRESSTPSGSESSLQMSQTSVSATAKTDHVTSASTTSAKPVVVGNIEFAGSAKEARERMRKKGDKRLDSNISLKDKYDILQRL